MLEVITTVFLGIGAVIAAAALVYIIGFLVSMPVSMVAAVVDRVREGRHTRDSRGTRHHPTPALHH